MNKLALFNFIFGAVVGGAGTWIGMHFYYKDKINRIEKDLDICMNRVDNLLKPIDGDDDIPDEYKRVKKEEPKDAEEAPKLSKEDMDKIREKLRANNEKTTAYSKMYTSPKDLIDDQAVADAENGEPVPGEMDIIGPEEGSEAKVTNIFEEVKKSKTRQPRIVKESEVDDSAEGWNIISLFLYNDGTVTDEEDRVFNDAEKEIMLGDSLTKYDFVNSDEKVIYVQCFAHNTFYEVNKFDKPFEK